ncbi:Hpt domain-containing protein [Paracidobacterium acidisoli]|uniref:HPt domain-containing protein n=1 Tax=Paracidobacterium acidisoli TaxID=2303751 RepID=A0A372IPY1_9BACT|nr:Hpt domain-containing protein [Paracidobacterium acidisoli]MBT9331366.1 Hpt domain-containing protein [Paracidobacterium acidisoli]
MADVKAQLAAKLQALWEASQATIQERMEALRAAQRRLAAHPSDGEARRSGHGAAHKLAGVLGVFGLPRGSELASEIEARLAGEAALSVAELSALAERIEALAAAIAARDAQIVE